MPLLDVSIRELTPIDAPALRDMLDMFASAFEDAESYQSAQPEETYLARLLSQEYFIAIAAFSEHSVVGGLVAYVLEKFEQARSEIYIYDLAVDARFRRQGIATGLINQLRAVAPARGAWVIYVQADDGDHPAIALYEKLGTREDVLHFDIPVRPVLTKPQRGP